MNMEAKLQCSDRATLNSSKPISRFAWHFDIFEVSQNFVSDLRPNGHELLLPADPIRYFADKPHPVKTSTWWLNPIVEYWFMASVSYYPINASSSLYFCTLHNCPCPAEPSSQVFLPMRIPTRTKVSMARPEFSKISSSKDTIPGRNKQTMVLPPNAK